MVQATGRSEWSGLSFEAFLGMAEQEGIDMSDEQHLRLLYEDTLGLLRSMAELVATQVDEGDPSDVYVPGSEAQ
jgi:hypothetical protein